MQSKRKFRLSAPSMRHHVEFLSAAVHLDWMYSLWLVRKYWSHVNDDQWKMFNSANMWQIEMKTASLVCDQWNRGWQPFSAISASLCTEKWELRNEASKVYIQENVQILKCLLTHSVQNLNVHNCSDSVMDIKADNLYEPWILICQVFSFLVLKAALQ